MKILITGGSGLVGSRLTEILQAQGYEVGWLSRRVSANNIVPTYICNYISGEIDTKAIASADIIVHLAGANIGEQRWSKHRQKIIIDSRVKTAELILATLKNTPHRLKAFISASAVGYYGAITSEEIFTEQSQAGSDFLSSVCKQWEAVADAFEGLQVRVAKIRSGVVFSQSQGALAKIALPFRFGAKVVLGSGKQYIPWIDIDDICNIYLKAIEDQSMQGAYNAVAPKYISYADFVGTLKSYYPRVWFNIKVPSLILRLVLGDMSMLLLEGSRVSPQKIIDAGFEFEFPTSSKAFDHLVKNN